MRAIGPAISAIKLSGNTPARLVKRAHACPSVELVANVHDVRPYLHGCGAMIVPLRIGGGSRLKIIEALAAECPVISTEIGAEGLPLVAGTHYTRADTVAEMAAAIVDGIRRPQRQQAIARLGRQVVVERHEWSMLADRLESLWLAHAGGGTLEA